MGQFNNQLLMAMCAAHLSDITGRTQIAQPFNLRSNEHPEKLFVHFNQVFNEFKGLKRYFQMPHENNTNAALFNSKDDLDTWKEGTDGFEFESDIDRLWTHKAHNLALQGNELSWFYCFHKYLLCTALKCSLFDHIVDMFVFSNTILNIVEEFIDGNKLERAIGVHLRAGYVDMFMLCFILHNVNLVICK